MSDINKLNQSEIRGHLKLLYEYVHLFKKVPYALVSNKEKPEGHPANNNFSSFEYSYFDNRIYEDFKLIYLPTFQAHHIYFLNNKHYARYDKVKKEERSGPYGNYKISSKEVPHTMIDTIYIKFGNNQNFCKFFNLKWYHIFSHHNPYGLEEVDRHDLDRKFNNERNELKARERDLDQVLKLLEGLPKSNFAGISSTTNFNF